MRVFRVQSTEVTLPVRGMFERSKRPGKSQLVLLYQSAVLETDALPGDQC
jgi:hypothetical protein